MQQREWESGTKRRAGGRKGSRVRFGEIINSGHLERAGIFGEGKPENAWTLLRLHSMPVTDSWPVSSKFTLFAFFVKRRLGLLRDFLSAGWFVVWPCQCRASGGPCGRAPLHLRLL